MRTIIWYIHLVFSLLATLPAYIRCKKLKKTLSEADYKAFAYNVASRFAKSQLKWAKTKLDIQNENNLPKGRAVLFVSNHQSNFDIGIFLGYLGGRKGFVAKGSLAKIPLLSHWMRELDMIFIDRDDIRQSAQAILKGIDNLKNGLSMVIFPEGTRSRCDHMGDFKAGSFKLATKAKVAIVPVTISGSYRIMEQNGGVIKPARVVVTIHPPIEPGEFLNGDTIVLAKRVKSTIESAM